MARHDAGREQVANLLENGCQQIVNVVSWILGDDKADHDLPRFLGVAHDEEP